jgi:hypothetical protein
LIAIVCRVCLTSGHLLGYRCRPDSPSSLRPRVGLCASSRDAASVERGGTSKKCSRPGGAIAHKFPVPWNSDAVCSHGTSALRRRECGSPTGSKEHGAFGGERDGFAAPRCRLARIAEESLDENSSPRPRPCSGIIWKATSSASPCRSRMRACLPLRRSLDWRRGRFSVRWHDPN